MPYVDNNGIRIHYQVDGNKVGPPLVLMHGTLQSLEDWYESVLPPQMARSTDMALKRLKN